MRDRGAVGDALADHPAGLAVVFETLARADAVRMLAVPQTIHAVVSEDNPLAERSSVRLRDCLAHPIALSRRRVAAIAALQRLEQQAGIAYRAGHWSHRLEVEQEWRQAVSK